MKRLVFALVALILPQSAFAGFGVTGFLGGGFNGFGGQTYAPITSGLPSLDYHSGDNLLQLDVLGLISSITTKGNFGFDAAYYKTTYKGEIHENWKGTVAPGLHVGFHQEPDTTTDLTHLDALVNLRMGVQALKEMGVGLYVVPGIGIHDVFDDKIYLAMSGGIELSVWVTGAGD